MNNESTLHFYCVVVDKHMTFLIDFQKNENYQTINKEILRFNLNQEKERFTLRVVDSYINWVLVHELVTLTKQRYVLAKKSLDLLNRKYKANLIDKVDILKQKDYIQNINQELLQLMAQQEVYLKELSLKSNLDKSVFKFPTFDLLSPLKIKTDVTFDDTLNNSIYESQFNIYDLEKTYYHNSKKPQLDLSLSYAFVGADTNFKNALSFDRYSSYVSLIYKKILKNNSNKADIRSVELKTQELKISYESDKLQYLIEKEKMITELESYKKIVAVNESQIQLAKQTVKEEKKLYEKGKGNLSFVLQAKENEHRSKIRYIKSLIEVHKLTYRYLALIDSLLTYFEESTI